MISEAQADILDGMAGGAVIWWHPDNLPYLASGYKMIRDLDALDVVSLKKRGLIMKTSLTGPREITNLGRAALAEYRKGEKG